MAFSDLVLRFLKNKKSQKQLKTKKHLIKFENPKKSKKKAISFVHSIEPVPDAGVCTYLLFSRVTPVLECC